jgi:hypothetical protein
MGTVIDPKLAEGRDLLLGDCVVVQQGDQVGCTGCSWDVDIST